MLKTLTARAIVPVAMAVTGFVALGCILLYSVLKKDLISDAVAYETALANTVIKSTRYAMLKSDRETLGNIVDNIDSQEGVEHLRIFSKKGVVMFSGDRTELNHVVDKKTAGCVGCHERPTPAAEVGTMQKARWFVNQHGTEVIGITAPIYNEPACFTAPCHVHSQSQKVLGTLDIGISAKPVLVSLKILRQRIAVFSAMVLFLSIGGMAALLFRNVFIPLRDIRDFVRMVKKGNHSGELSAVNGGLNELARDVRDVAHSLRNAVQEIDELKKPQEPRSKTTTSNRDVIDAATCNCR